MKHRHTNYSVVIVVFAVMVFRFPGLRSVLGVLRVFCRVWGSESRVWDSYLSHAMLCLQSGAHETPCTFVIFSTAGHCVSFRSVIRARLVATVAV